MLEPIRTIEILQKNSHMQSFKSGEVIFTAGERGHVMYGVIEGQVEMLVDGKVVEVINKGDIFGQGALIHEDHLRASTAIAKTDCVIAILDRQHFLFAIQEVPAFCLEVMRSYSDRFRRLKMMF
jgi:CRP-like cAMP-binding protein